jgi:hypothetical protein
MAVRLLARAYDYHGVPALARDSPSAALADEASRAPGTLRLVLLDADRRLRR